VEVDGQGLPDREGGIRFYRDRRLKFVDGEILGGSREGKSEKETEKEKKSDITGASRQSRLRKS
jgi:hypothetical protein